MRALQVAVAAVRPTRGREALWKLGLDDVDAGVAVTAVVPELAGLPVLREAAARRATVTFDYRGKRRRLDPYGLLLRTGFWYVVGHDHEHGEQRTYRVDRITGPVEALEGGAFERPAGFDLRTRSRVTPSASAETPIDAVAVVRVDADRAASVERELGSGRVVRRGATGRSRSRCRAPTCRRSARGCSACSTTPKSSARPTCAPTSSPGWVRWRVDGDGDRSAHGGGSPARPAGDAAVADGARRGAARRGRPPLPDGPGAGRRRPRAGGDVRAAAVRRRDDRRVHRRRHRRRRRAPPVHPAAAADGAGGLRPRRGRAGGDAAARRRPRGAARARAAEAGRRARRRRRRRRHPGQAGVGAVHRRRGRRRRGCRAARGRVLDAVTRRGDDAHDHAAARLQRSRRLVRRRRRRSLG